jgi:pimeloyl-ACP methyl ester carboxylesterase
VKDSIKRKITLKSIMIGSRKIAYRQAGQGDPIILLHGSHRSSYLFQPAMAELSKKFFVIAPDRPGYGNSDPILPQDPLPDMAAFCREFLSALGIPSAHWIGESRGGGICIELAAETPSIVQRLVLVAPVGLPPRELPKPAEIGARSGWEWFLERSLEHPEMLDEEDKEVILANLAKAEPYETMRLLDQSPSYVVEGLVSSIIRVRAPVLLAWGRQDPVFPVECVERFRELLINLQATLILDDARHLLHFERVAEFCDAVLEFLEN